MNETRELTRFVVETRLNGLPADIIRLAKERLLDTLGVSLFAVNAPWSRMVRETVLDRGAKGRCTLWGSVDQCDPAGAALVNGTLGHGYELDDTHLEGVIHPGCVVVPAALAAGEHIGATGCDLLLAIVLGYEIMARVALALGPGLLDRGHHPTATTGVFGAVTAAGRIWGLNAAEMLNAFGIAGSLASGIVEFARDPEGTMVKRLYGGRPAESGILAADLARRGFTGPATVLEGHYGFLRAYSDAPNSLRLVGGLGQEWAIRSVSTKPYALCAALHSIVDALSQVIGNNRVEDVQAIELGLPRATLEQNMIYQPRSLMSAQYSAPFAAALTVMGRHADPSAYTEEGFSDPRLLQLAATVRGYEDPEIQALYPANYGARVRVRFANGSVREAVVRAPKGTPDDPFTPAELERRFVILARTTCGPRQCQEIRTLIETLEASANVRALGQLVAASELRENL